MFVYDHQLLHHILHTVETTFHFQKKETKPTLSFFPPIVAAEFHKARNLIFRVQYFITIIYSEKNLASTPNINKKVKLQQKRILLQITLLIFREHIQPTKGVYAHCEEEWQFVIEFAQKYIQVPLLSWKSSTTPFSPNWIICPLPHFQATKQPGQESVPPTTGASTTRIICGTNSCCFQTSVCIHPCTPRTSVTISSHAAPSSFLSPTFCCLIPHLHPPTLHQTWPFDLEPHNFFLLQTLTFSFSRITSIPQMNRTTQFAIIKNILKFLAQQDGLPVASDGQSNLK